MADVSISGPRRAALRVTIALVAVAASVTLTGQASAHLDPAPATVKPGAKAVIGFTVAHGCSGSPTNKVTMKVPAGVTDAVPTAPNGWSARLAGGVATFSGPPIAATRKTTVTLSFTAPSAIGPLVFPAVQYCLSGENDWIQATPAKGPEPKYPAPIVNVSSRPTPAKPRARKHT